VKALPESEWRGRYEATAEQARELAYLSLYNLSFAEAEAGRPSQAVVLLERALRMMPERQDGWLESGRQRLAAGDLEGAELDLKRAS
jgi:Tfp pilus assembly protein PilF